MGLNIDEVDFLPTEIKEELRKSGISELKDFQLRGLEIGLSGKNLLVVAPTGAGKTLIGELVAVLKIIRDKGKVMYLVPYKALAEEIYSSLVHKYPFIRFEIGTGDYLDKPNELLGRDGDFLIVTYEKADSIIRTPPSWVKELSLVIVDEVHLISDYDRGPILDSFLTHCKIRGIQIIALSATIPNPGDLAEWLDAQLIESQERPVKLVEGVYLPKSSKVYLFDPNPHLEEEVIVYKSPLEEKNSQNILLLDHFIRDGYKHSIKGKIKEVKIREVRKIRIDKCKDSLTIRLAKRFSTEYSPEHFYCIEISKSKSGKRGLMGALLDLINDTFSRMKELKTKWQVLIFRKSRRLAQLTAKNIADFMRRSGFHELFPEAKNVANRLLEEVDELTPLTEELANYISYGVAFHHAGLSHGERKIIENAFRRREIGVIVATPTLAAGINLPARRVIIEHKFYGGGEGEIDVSSYKQRSGRAGRPGFDSVGEAILIAYDEDEVLYLFDKYIFGNLELVESKLGLNLPILRDQVLALISSSKRINIETVRDFFNKTFYHFIQNKRFPLGVLEEDFLDRINIVTSDLMEWGFVREKEGFLVSTAIGKVVSKLYLDPLTAHQIVEFLEKENELDEINLILLVTSTPDVSNFRIKALSLLKKPELIKRKLERLDKNLVVKLKERVGTMFRILEYLENGYHLYFTPEEESAFASLILTILVLQWVSGVPLREILEELTPNFGAGDFLEMVRSTSRLIYCAIEIARKLGFDKSSVREFMLIREMIDKGVPKQMLELTRIPLIGRIRAQILYKHGYDNLEKLAKADFKALSKLPNIGEKIAKRAIEYAQKQVSLS